MTDKLLYEEWKNETLKKKWEPLINEESSSDKLAMLIEPAEASQKSYESNTTP